MQVHVHETPEGTAQAAATWLATAMGAALAARGRCHLALSGGRTPWRMLDALPAAALADPGLEIWQVDERVVPFDDDRRNAAQIVARLVASRGGIDPARFHAMPVERTPLSTAADDYAAELSRLGNPPVLDIVQLGLGADAHTASLVPGDPLLEVGDRMVGLSVPYQGVVRMSLTFPVLNAARERLWLVTGADKVDALRALIAGDPDVPCGRVTRARAVVFADAAAAAGLG
jgi:6-phosphogluconolactonase